MNQALVPILRRRSIRAYTDREVDDAVLNDLLAAAMAAPSAVARDPWRFVVVRTSEGRAAIADCLPNGKMLAKAPLGLVVCGDLAAAHDHQLSYLLQDCAAAIENCLIAAAGLGLGACWLGVHPRDDRVRNIGVLLKLPDGVLPIAVIAIGYPGEEKQPRTRYKPEYVHFETW